MGFFSAQTKPAEAPEVVEEPVEEATNLPELPEKQSEPVIAKDMTITGRVSGSGLVKIEGVVEGELVLNGAAVVTETGRIKGPVEADVVHVSGYIEGDVLAREHLRLEMTGTVDGNVKTGSFVIEDGGCLNGRCTMTKKGKEPTFLY